MKHTVLVDSAWSKRCSIRVAALLQLVPWFAWLHVFVVGNPSLVYSQARRRARIHVGFGRHRVSLQQDRVDLGNISECTDISSGYLTVIVVFT